ncbi:hypothetical protein [Leisingera sp. ANG59]|uniref:hypothetical protein n=1 Tax=Leisingera sp. ANG59 TaxID=2675221 RepID=UPI0020C6D46A|nr:hypothetical protein [Leisingera sp. ANG59]
MERPEDLLGDAGLMKELKIKLMERMMGAELTTHLGYEEGEDAPAGQSNRRWELHIFVGHDTRRPYRSAESKLHLSPAQPVESIDPKPKPIDSGTSSTGLKRAGEGSHITF